MAQSNWATVRRIYKDQGITSVAAHGLKKLVHPVVKVGSLYFLERELSLPMPSLEPNSTIVAREGTLADVHLLDALPHAKRNKTVAVARLKRGDHWFVGIEKATGKLANYRWASLNRAFIPELNRDLIVQPGQAYIYDLETAAEFRRLGIEATTRQFTYETLRRRFGVNRIIVYIRADNYASLCAGRQYLTATSRIWFVRVRGSVFTHVRRNSKLPEFRPAAALTPHAALRAHPSSSRR
jgi:hypothetical protein